MENKTKTQSAEVAQASTAQTTSKEHSTFPRTYDKPDAIPWDVWRYGKEIMEVMDQDSAIGFFTRLQAQDSAYYHLLHTIDAGGGWRERQPNENPADALADIRLELDAISPQQVSERAYLLQTMGTLLEAAECLAKFFKREYFNPSRTNVK
jgi:hypothetical protein